MRFWFFLSQPDHVLINPALPKTRSGKIMRRLLRKIACKETSPVRRCAAGNMWQHAVLCVAGCVLCVASCEWGSCLLVAVLDVCLAD